MGLRAFFLTCLLVFISACTPVFVFTHFPDMAEEILSREMKKAETDAEDPSSSADALIHACSLKVMVAYGFILEKADRKIELNYKKGIKLYMQAHGHFVQALRFGEKAISKKYSISENWLTGKSNDVPQFLVTDVPYLYWTAAGLAGAIKSSRGNPEWVIRLPEVGKYLEKAIELDPNWNQGALYSAMITYSVSRSDISDGHQQAKKYYDKAMEAAGGVNPGAMVSYAESVLVKRQDRKKFQQLLTEVLSLKGNKKLEQVLARHRAEWLLSRTEELFF